MSTASSPRKRFTNNKLSDKDPVLSTADFSPSSSSEAASAAAAAAPSSSASSSYSQKAGAEKSKSSPIIANAVPTEILEDEEINAAISQILPDNYSFEIHKTIHHIRKNGSKCVALQMPEGLTLWATGISDIIQRFTEATTVIMGDVTYGACCVDDYTAMALGCDMLVHYGHSCLVPVDQTSIKTLYVFVEISIDPSHLAATVRANFPSDREEFRSTILGGSGGVPRASSKDGPAASLSGLKGLEASRAKIEVGFDEISSSLSPSSSEDGVTRKQPAHLALVGTVQFINAIHGLKESLEQEQEREDVQISGGGLAPSKERLMLTNGVGGETVEHIRQASRLKNWSSGPYRVTVPQVKPLSPGEVLGCTSPKLKDDIDAIIYIGDGRFHLESIMIANPRIPAFRYDPYTKRFVRELYDHAEMRKMRGQAVRMAEESVVSMNLDPEKGEEEEQEDKRSSEQGGQQQQKDVATGWGLILGTLGRQGSLRVLESLSNSLSSHSPPIPGVPILLSELSPQKLSLFGHHLSTFIQSSCPRLSIDWGSAFPKPLLSPYEAAVALGRARKWDEDVDGLGLSRKPALPGQVPPPRPKDERSNGVSIASETDGDYPMDFYSDSSLGPWTPRHGLARVAKQRPAGGNRALLKKSFKAKVAAPPSPVLNS
ncbi:hypothetical protein IE53DRAFT_387292 [Violaceomyces palustris]|uniref:Uncharacterized protein n=1 Tax=Violaceomyces palustris TaxID=1673888 RepID=A0ACD0NXA4_9BASI|nr:hypothetical protein IE53DRAFT_387292 [Violaceomyces palustris]